MIRNKQTKKSAATATRNKENATTALNKNSYLTGKLFLRYLFPSVLSLMASSINTLIDTIILSNFTLSAGLATMSIVAPVNLFYITLSSTVCVGASICFSSALGEKNFEKARAYFGFAIIAVLALGIIFTAIFMPLTSQIATLLGARSEILAYAKDYLFFYFMGGCFVMLLYVPHNFSKALGKPSVPLILLLIMAIVNIVLTYIFVAVIKMGTGGAALATSIANAIAVIVGCFFIFKRGSNLSPTFFKLTFKECKLAISCGSAAGLNNLMRFLVVLGINTIITYFALSALLPAYSISRSVQELMLSIVVGIGQSVMPLIAMFSGEKDNKAIRTVLKKAFIIGLICVTLGVILTTLMNEPLQKLFGVPVSKTNGYAIVLLCVSLIPSFINTLLSSHFCAIKKYKFSQFILIMRVVFTLLSAFVLTVIVGENSIWWGFTIAEILTLGATVFLMFFYIKKHTELDKLLLEKKYDDKNNLLFFSIKATESEVVSMSEKVEEFFEEKKVPSKKLMRLSLAIEELLVSIINQKLIGSNAFVDISIFCDDSGIIMRFKYGGKQYNPLDIDTDMNYDDNNFGLSMLKKTIPGAEYYWIFGLNNLMLLV